MSGEIEKASQEDVMNAIMSFNDPNVLTNVFAQMNWSYTLEIEETVKLAQQDENLSLKFKAIKHLRELLKEAAEKSGMTATVTQTVSGDNGVQTTFHATKMLSALSPAPIKIESKLIEEKKDVQEQEEKQTVDGGSLEIESDTTSNTEAGSGGDGQHSGTGDEGRISGDDLPESTGEGVGRPDSDGARGCDNESSAEFRTTPAGLHENSSQYNQRQDRTDRADSDQPCVNNKPPVGINPDLFPGVAGTSAD